jgi:DNA primase
VGGVLDAALESADPEAREVLERAAVIDIEADGRLEALNLLAAAVRRELASHKGITDPEILRGDRDARLHLEMLDQRETADAAAGFLLGWLSAPANPAVEIGPLGET